jgi:hypothetical protein
MLLDSLIKKMKIVYLSNTLFQYIMQKTTQELEPERRQLSKLCNSFKTPFQRDHQMDKL